MARRARPLLGTLVVVEATATHGDPAVANAAIEAAFAAIAEVQRLMAFHDPASDLSRLNRAPVGMPVDLHPWTCEVLAMALRLAEESARAFDCSIGRHLVRAGHLPAHEAHWTQAQPGEDDGPAVWLEGTRACRRRDVLLDLGGIAKGHAVDRAITALAAFDLRNALVNAGGDLRHAGVDAVTIGVRQPRDPGRLAASVTLANAALASSVAGGLDPAAPPPAALVDARRARPLAKGNAASVVAPSCLLADALTKVVLVSRNRDHPLLARYGADVVYADLTTPDDSHA